MRPVIGITTTNIKAIDGIPDGVPPSWAMSKRFITAPTAAGGLPWLIPLLEGDEGALRDIFDRLDGLLIPGGADVDPGSYGDLPRGRMEGVDPPRDRVEAQLIEWSIAAQMPVLGICRGIQLMNLVLGGTLNQDIEAEVPGAVKHDFFPNQGYERDHRSHDVRLDGDSMLARILGVDSLPVNSMHHQSIRELADPLVISARAPDGVVEAVELPRHPFFIGVQWHPEALTDDPRMHALFDSFIEAARRFGAARSRPERAASLGGR